MYFYDIFKNLIMKTKDILLVGAGATIIYLLWRRSQKSKIGTSLTGGIGATTGTTTGATTSGTTTSGATSSEPEQVYGLQLPPNMGLPNLTAGTGVPTEVAVQQGGVTTNPTPAIVTTPILSIEDALGNGIKPIKSIANTPCEQKWNDYAQTIRVSSKEEYEKMKTQFLNECNGYVKSPKDLSVSQDVLPVSSDEYLNNIIKTEQFGSNSGKNLGIERATLSANGMNTNGRVINGTLFRGVM